MVIHSYISSDKVVFLLFLFNNPTMIVDIMLTEMKNNNKSTIRYIYFLTSILLILYVLFAYNLILTIFHFSPIKIYIEIYTFVKGKK